MAAWPLSTWGGGQGLKGIITWGICLEEMLAQWCDVPVRFWNPAHLSQVGPGSWLRMVRDKNRTEEAQVFLGLWKWNYSSLFVFCFNELVSSCVTGSMKAHVFNFHIRIDMESSTISPVRRPWDHIERTFVMCSGCIWQDPTRADMRRGRYLNCTRGFVYLSLNTGETFPSVWTRISGGFSSGILSCLHFTGRLQLWCLNNSSTRWGRNGHVKARASPAKDKNRRTHRWNEGRTLAAKDAPEVDQCHTANHLESFHAVPCIHSIVVVGWNASIGIQEACFNSLLVVTFVKPWTQPSGLHAFPLCSWPRHCCMQATHLMWKSLSKTIDQGAILMAYKVFFWCDPELIILPSWMKLWKGYLPIDFQSRTRAYPLFFFFVGLLLYLHFGSAVERGMRIFTHTIWVLAVNGSKIFHYKIKDGVFPDHRSWAYTSKTSMLSLSGCSLWICTLQSQENQTAFLSAVLQISPNFLVTVDFVELPFFTRPKAKVL